MASVNRVILIGNLGADVETRYLQSGDAVANIRLATTERYKEKSSGEMKEVTEWHRVNFFGRLAEIATEYLRKGAPVYIEGRIRTRKYQAQDGSDRYSTEIIADQMKMLGSRPDGGQQSSRDQRPQQQRSQQPRQQGRSAANGGASGFDDMDDDIPW